ncbi:MAG: hypothetical protein D6830_01080 [Ignavibacteria bacterium]|nr:MAG: hypothetical protein D6830_01080 [Ignavibacteria bacterium]
MKFSMKYIYIGVIVIVAIMIVVSSISFEDNQPATDTMPNDDVHKGMGQTFGGENPSKDNVSSEFMHQIEMYKKAVEKDPKDTVSMRKYAELMSAAHKPEEGNKYFEKIIAIDPNRVDILTNIVFNYYNMQQLDKATKFNEMLLKVDPDNLDAIYNKGVIEASKGNMNAAKSLWEKVIKMAPDSEVGKMAKSNLARLSNTK